MSEILEQEAEIRARKPVSPKRKQRGRTALFVTAPIVVLLTAFNIAVAQQSAIEPRPQHVAEREARTAIYLAMQQVEAYRLENGLKAPETLEEVGADQPGLDYVSEGRSYSLVARVDGVEEVFHSGDDRTPFEIAAADLFLEGS